MKHFILSLVAAAAIALPAIPAAAQSSTFSGRYSNQTVDRWNGRGPRDYGRYDRRYRPRYNYYRNYYRGYYRGYRYYYPRYYPWPYAYYNYPYGGYAFTPYGGIIRIPPGGGYYGWWY